MKEKKSYESPRLTWVCLNTEEILSASSNYPEELIPTESGDGDHWDW